MSIDRDLVARDSLAIALRREDEDQYVHEVDRVFDSLDDLLFVLP